MPGGRSGESSRNGAPRAGAIVPSFAAAGGAAPAYDDPMSKVLGLDEKTSGVAAWFGFTSGSTLMLVALMALTSAVAWMHTVHARQAGPVDEIEIMREEPPPPPPAATEAPEPKPEPAVAPPHHAREAPPPPPAPAQAAKVLTQEPDPNEPVDLTGNTIVQGNAEAYAGGFTSAAGSNANAVHAMPAATGVPGGTGPARPAPQVAGPDRSRPPSVGGSTEWNAPFPPEADDVNEAWVTIEVEVKPDGSAAAVQVLSDPGNGFGREARRYALKQHYSPALDHDGNAISGKTKVRVHFWR